MISSFDLNYPQMFVYIADLARIAREDSEWARDAMAIRKRFEAIVISIIEKGQADGSLRTDLKPDLVALALFGMVNWMHRWYTPGSKHSPKEIARTFAVLVLEGVRTDHGAETRLLPPCARQ